MALAFMLVGTFAFASNGDATIKSNNNYIETVSTDFTIDCDATYDVSLDAENLVCGFTVEFIDDYGSTSYWEDCSFSGGFGDFDDWISHILDWLGA